MKANLIVLDCETGGMECEKNPITQIALQIIEPIKLQSTFDFDTFVQPYNNLIISKEALAGSRVTMNEIKEGIDVDELLKYLITIFKGANKSGKSQTLPYVVGHNVGFDLQFLQYLFAYKNKNLYDYIQRIGLDTLVLCKLFEAGTLKTNESTKYNLTACCERLGIKLHGAHGAPADVEATRLLFTKLIKNFRHADKTISMGSNDMPGKSSIREGFHFEF